MAIINFEEILKGLKYDINKQIVENTLKEIGYSVKDSPYGIDAKKFKGTSRIHFIIEVHGNGNIYKDSEIRLHEDVYIGPLHPTRIQSKRITEEIRLFKKELKRQIKKQQELK